MTITVITGIPGAGKTTVLNRALEKLEKKGIRIESVNYGTIMLESAGKAGLVKNRDELRKLALRNQKNIQKLAGRKIAALGSKKPVIVDTHCTISTPKGYLAGLPEWVLRKINPDTIVLIEANPMEIKKRRAKDTSRERDMETEEDIDAHQDINRAAAISYSVLTGATIKILYNHSDKLGEAVNELVRILE